MPDPVSLSPTDAACLEILRLGNGRPTMIVLRSGYGHARIRAALASLSDLQLAQTDRDGYWSVTECGRTVAFSVQAPKETRGRKRSGVVAAAGTPAARLLALLATPRHRAELQGLLGLTRERVRQLLVALSAAGLIRGAGTDDPTFALARSDDPVVLLTQAQERVLSAFDEEQATTLRRLATAARRRLMVTAEIAGFLCDAGLIETAGRMASGELWRLTQAGRSHWQRSPIVPKGPQPEEPALSFHAQRMLNVMTYLAEKGEARPAEMASAFGYPPRATDGLMQFLKRQGIVRAWSKTGHEFYLLTEHGRQTQQTMTQLALRQS